MANAETRPGVKFHSYRGGTGPRSRTLKGSFRVQAAHGLVGGHIIKLPWGEVGFLEPGGLGRQAPRLPDMTVARFW